MDVNKKFLAKCLFYVKLYLLYKTCLFELYKIERRRLLILKIVRLKTDPEFKDFETLMVPLKGTQRSLGRNPVLLRTNLVVD